MIASATPVENAAPETEQRADLFAREARSYGAIVLGSTPHARTGRSAAHSWKWHASCSAQHSCRALVVLTPAGGTHV
jgi:hypothetical protein